MSKSLLSGAGAKGLALCLCLQLFCGGCRENHGNHLSGATSPYLRGQAGDPVDWYEWGEEALARAKKEDKPLLVSIGFSACHWCHVMERESFTDSSVARIMNERFVCIKVDREERPDVDQVYSTACQLITGSAGWPLNAFALPDGKPFFAGTYYSTAGWKNLLLKISDAYRDQRSKVELQARALANGVAEPGLSSGAGADSSAGAGPGPGAGPEPLFRGLYGKMDLSHGGLQGTPKFPNPSMLSFVLQYYFASKDTRALDAAMISLTNMALGGIYDQVGGGFARFATDSSWHIPHFEKMLGDNAALLSVYAHAYQITRDPFIKDILQGIMAFTERDLANGSGGYFSSVDADTKAGEGAYYSWTAEELRKELPDEYGLVADYFQVSAEGNWKDGRNILFADQTPVAFARSRHLDEATLSAKLNAARKRLLSARERREKPLVDKKILTSWNALLICGYLDAYAATGEAGCLRSAVGIGRFLETHAWQADGGLRHVVREERVSSGEAFLEDYAYLAEACLRLYELTFSRHWLDLAKRLADRAIS
ncbi:MAG: thioredoxin domain-containing protein [Bacteroidota bacterium]|nr:thioredoxin domain-containing protein [Bacteroidota bacterium]